MHRKVAAVWVSLFIMVSSIVILVEIAERVEAPNTLYVGGGGPGNYSKIQWAIDNTSDGDTVFVYNGTYYENVVVNKTINLTGENRYITTINGSGSGNVVRITAPRVNVTHFTIIYSGSITYNAGFQIESDYNIIAENNIFSNKEGIFLSNANGNSILGNNISNNVENGIFISNSTNDNIADNIISENKKHGIRIKDSSNGTIFNNILNNNWWGVFSNDMSRINISNNSINLDGIIFDNSCDGNYIGYNTITGANEALYLMGSQNNEIINNIIDSNNYTGITLFESQYNNVTNNVISNNDRGGISINFFADNNNISKNFLYNNSEYGIKIEDSFSNNIVNNNITSNDGYGISVDSASLYTTISKNKCINNTIRILSDNNILYENKMENCGIYIMGDSDVFTTQEIPINNTVNNKPVYYYKNINMNNVSVPSDAGEVICGNVTSLKIENLNLSNGFVGIEIGFSKDIYIANNTCSNNYYGILLGYTDNLFIINNTCDSNYYGISISFSHNNSIIENKCSGNENEGLWIHWSSNNVIENNIFSNNNQGIRFWASTNNTIANNTCQSNNRLGTLVPFGIALAFSSDNNLFYHNNFINNINQADDVCDNYWDNGYPLGGNFWSDYTGVDQFNGPNQNISGNDGIGDTNHSIDDDSMDNYPLMSPMGNLTYLFEGWNLISIPDIQPNPNLGAIFYNIIGSYDAVQWYNISEASDNWKHNHTKKSSQLNDLNYIDHTIGLWIHITEPGGVLVDYPGNQPSSNQTIHLHPGWNMVGYPSLSTHNRTVGLNNLTFDTHVDAIQWYDVSTGTWHFMDPDNLFLPGRGYWVHSKVEAEWEVPL